MTSDSSLIHELAACREARRKLEEINANQAKLLTQYMRERDAIQREYDMLRDRFVELSDKRKETTL